VRIRRTFRQSAIPFLVLAEPLTFFLFQGGTYCESLCVQPTPIGLGTLGLVLVGSSVVVAAVTTLATRSLKTDSTWIDRLTHPRRLTLVLLFAFFGGFLFFLTLDATSVPGALWKPIVLPLSLVPFLPVWALYAATYPVALIGSVVGIEFGGGATLLVRSVVLFGGFGFAAIWQAVLATLVVEAVQSG
jgi:hypothetical protein